MYCPKCGRPNEANANFCSSCGTPLTYVVSAVPRSSPASDPAVIAGQIQRKEKIVNIIWIVIGAIQILAGYTLIAGIWNIVNAIGFLLKCSEIVPGNADIVPYFEQRRNGLIVIAVINLILGGVIGVALAIYELSIRKTVLDNREIFESGM